MKKKLCVFPGTFDPFTLGHLDILRRAAGLFDHVIVAMLINAGKSPVFTVEERTALIEASCRAEGIENFSVKSSTGLLADFCRECGASAVIRGLRTTADFEYEQQIAAVNRRLNPELETICLFSDPTLGYLSSSIVREVGSYGGPLTGMVPAQTEKYIQERLLKK